jgi:formylglycine-generating enzyme required for sulfatase activity
VYSVTVSGVPVDWSILTYTDVPTTFNDDWNAATVSWTNNGYRLPTEMEWMWAAMGAPADGQGGGVNTTGYTKAFAGTKAGVVNIIGDYVWYSANSGTKTHASGTKTENELGLFDMSGNAFEWCWDGYVSNYLAGTLIDYRGPDNYGLYRVLRSGGFASSADQCTIAYRTYSGPNSQVGSVGLRVVRN